MADDLLSDVELKAGARGWWDRLDRSDIVARIDSGDYGGGSWWQRPEQLPLTRYGRDRRDGWP